MKKKKAPCTPKIGNGLRMDGPTGQIWVKLFQAQGKAALHLAAENGHLQVAEALLGKKAYVNARSKSGITPLHLACQNGYTRLVKLLIDIHKANIESLSLVSMAYGYAWYLKLLEKPIKANT